MEVFLQSTYYIDKDHPDVMAFAQENCKPNDSVLEKAYSQENEMICWHYDNSKQREVKGINLLTGLYFSQGISIPVTYYMVKKTEYYMDKKTWQSSCFFNPTYYPSNLITPFINGGISFTFQTLCSTRNY